ncbi:hypothetical protein DVH24_011703 [Malus domestica]|uniref:Sugar phosphate transporter domain-containing protein n=1 Tax=Malus domestica TaxID=3750 RepID=A0A498JU38_MALDO|nr:hypothetical protein DVH24_011703 [Malus domestica]
MSWIPVLKTVSLQSKGTLEISIMLYLKNNMGCRCKCKLQCMTKISPVKLRTPAFGSPEFLSRRCLIKSHSLSLPNFHKAQKTSRSSSLTPLHISSGECISLAGKNQKGTFCKAYEADQSRPLKINIELPDQQEAAQRLKIGLYFATWWALNVVFNIYNKKVLNMFPYPWLTSTLSLATGSLMMLVSRATRIAEAPKTDLGFWKTLLPATKRLKVAVAHTIGHVAGTVSMAKVAVSFTHIIKSNEPAFSVLVSRFLLGESFPLSVYLSLFPIIGG